MSEIPRITSVSLTNMAICIYYLPQLRCHKGEKSTKQNHNGSKELEESHLKTENFDKLIKVKADKEVITNETE